MSLVENIKLLCMKVGTSIPKLEKELGFGRGSVYNWDKNSPSIDKVQKVANYFKVSLDRVIYGFELTEFVQMVNYVRNDRTYEQFSEDTGISIDEIALICMGIITEPPSEEVVRRIASSNPVDYLVSEDDLLEAAGFTTEASDPYTIAAHHDGEDWTEEELEEIERFKEFVRSKRKQRE